MTGMKGGRFGLNLRYPVTNDLDVTIRKLTEVVSPMGFSCTAFVGFQTTSC